MMHKRVRILFIILLAAFGLLTPLLNALWNRVPAVSPDEAMAAIPVSYTHLTLPTIYSV